MTPVWVTRVITLPDGTEYVPQSDNLKEEFRKAAMKAGLHEFYAYIDGKQVDPEDIGGMTVSGLTDLPHIELAVRPYNKAAQI